MDRVKVSLLIALVLVFRASSLILLIAFLLMLAYCEPDGSWYIEH